MNVAGRVVQIAGSCHRETRDALVRYSHAVVKELTRKLIAKGARVLAGVGDEPMTSDQSGSVVFYWTILETAGEAIRGGTVPRATDAGAVVAVVSTTKAIGRIPSSRKSFWDELVNAGAVELQFLEPRWSAGALQRTSEAAFGDVLVVLGGAEGVEHLAQLYAANGKPVIPLDIPMMGSTGSATLGSPRLALESLAHPENFAAIDPPTIAGTAFAAISTQCGSIPAVDVAQRVLTLIEKFRAPPAFYVRLLDKGAPEFVVVEAYFRQVVDPFVLASGYVPVEMGSSPHRFVWINEAIFKLIQGCGIVVADLTGMRANCTLELGFAFGCRKRVLVTAKSGTQLPFDLRPYECHIWSDPTAPGEEEALRQYFLRNAYRPSP